MGQGGLGFAVAEHAGEFAEAVGTGAVQGSDGDARRAAGLTLFDDVVAAGEACDLDW